MEVEVFFDCYRICRDAQGKPEEAGRTGAAISYKAVDEESNQTVLLQLVPLAVIDQARRDEFEARAKAVRDIDHINIARVVAAGVQHDYFAFVTEYIPGETADRWVVDHGTMTPDAVLRIGIQVVRATAAAAFQGLTHRAIQPSNIIILPGEAPTGGWPFIKLLNLGVAALELHGETDDARELAPAVAPQFASPEQVRNEQIDFRSEMYSLGATMCFLLTGAVPLPSIDDANTRRRGRRRLPELKSMPKPVRRLLGSMLAENPEERPLDPVALERYMVTILGEIERRQAWGRKLGIPLAASMQRKIARSRSPFAQIVRGSLAVAALLIALAAIGAILYPEYFHRTRTVEQMGVPVGVPVAEQTNTAPPPPVTAAPPPNIVAKASPSPSTPPAQTPAIVQASPAPSASPAQNIPSGSSVPATAKSQVAPPASSNIASTRQLPAPTSAPGATASPAVQQTTAAPDQTSSGLSAPLAQNTRPNNSAEPPKTAARTTRSPATVADADTDTSLDSEREPEPPTEGPDDEDAAPATRSRHYAKAQPKITTRYKTKSIARNDNAQTQRSRGRMRAHFLGTTPTGKWLLRLPSGRIAAVTPPRHRRPPVAVRPRVVPYPQEPPVYYGPPPYGYPPPEY